MNKALDDTEFFFTAQSLSTFESCPMKFKKKYIDAIRWDKGADDVSGKRLQSGSAFHLAARRYFLGTQPGFFPENDYGESINKWIDNLRPAFQQKPGVGYYPELKLRLIEGSYRFEANLDLLEVSDNSVSIWDWKTAPGKFAGRKDYGSSLQTVVYLYVLGRQLYDITGKASEKAEVFMRYWQPDPPGLLSEIRLDKNNLLEYGNLLKGRVDEIRNFDWEAFDQRLYHKECGPCQFHAFCRRYKTADNR